MSTAAGAKIVDVAGQILADIRRRKLRPGDSYLTTAETAHLLHVSGSTVNRALQLLAQRGVIQRRQRQGTLIADLETESPLRRVHLVVREDHLRTEGLWADGVLLGLQGALAGVELQFNFRPEIDEADYVNQLIGDVLRSRQAAGFVLIRSTVTAQRLVVASGLPAVVSGTLQPSIRDLPSVDRDQRRIGVLLAEYLLKRRCRRFLVLMRERLTAGDHAMLDGALATLATAGVGLDAVTLRCLPTDAEAIQAATGELLDGSRAPVGCLCRSEFLARGVERAAGSLRLSGRRSPTVVVADAVHRQSSDTPFPCIEPTVTPEEWGAALGRMLVAVARGERPDPYQLVIPVRLWTPPGDR
jgi:hypothetical protein